MDNFISILGFIFGFLGGSSALITWLLYRKQEKRMKNSAAVEKEVSTLRNAVETLQNNLKFYSERLDSMQKLIMDKDSYINVLSKEKDTLEIKHSKNKSAINKAFECKFCTDTSKCVVIIEKTKNDEDYAKMLTKK